MEPSRLKSSARLRGGTPYTVMANTVQAFVVAFGESRDAASRYARITTTDATDVLLAKIFRLVDEDSSGTVSLVELIHFVENDGASKRRMDERRKAQDEAWREYEEREAASRKGAEGAARRKCEAQLEEAAAQKRREAEQAAARRIARAESRKKMEAEAASTRETAERSGANLQQELLSLHDKIEHTKKMGIVYLANVITDVSSGCTAQRLGVQQGWKILAVNGTEMPSSDGAEQTIHAYIGAIKERDERIIIKFHVPGSDDVTLTFESYVTRVDLKKALQEHTALALVLGVDPKCDSELDALFEALDSDGDSAISRAEWRDFVAGMLARERAKGISRQALEAAESASWRGERGRRTTEPNEEEACARVCQARM